MDVDLPPTNANGNSGDELAEYNLDEYDEDPDATSMPFTHTLNHGLTSC
jgi:hypothetical protein